MGINSADLYNVTERTGDTITYNRTKTKARRLDGAKMMVNIPKAILHWLRSTKTQVANDSLISIATMQMKETSTKPSTTA